MSSLGCHYSLTYPVNNIVNIFSQSVTQMKYIALFRRSVMNMGIRLCNKLPTRVKQLDNFRDFKRKLKFFLSYHPFYILNEFFIFEEDNRTNKQQHK